MINCLQNSDKSWCHAKEDLVKELNMFYEKLFTTSNPTRFDEVLNEIPGTVTRQMSDQITRPFNKEEIRQDFFFMNPNKAPGPVSMSSLFFKQFWHIVGRDITLAIQSFFHSGFMLSYLNETIISLIPKVDIPTNLSQYRPIALCNVIYKAITKLLANRLKPFLNYCISDNQSAFLAGRQILDNVIVIHECLHFLKNKRQGKKIVMALKLDMAKAYDRVE
ncbi:hypothetical protein ACH5RR_016915 [Cinchona calisaya]|uniref:Reverse transcriptase domain-containing protein n=1 Tax=Cinchona calisaya TaxID=153742 RepID=A0ABD2ZZD6_9GENT